MASGYLNTVLGHLRRLSGARPADDLSDGCLLERFTLGQDQAAFSALLERHGPMVLAECRHLLREPADIDDAFQATFLVLVSRAQTIRHRDSVGSWLYGVAYRTAHRAREREDRRRHLERLAAGLPARAGEEPAAALARRELGAVLNEELRLLPEKYRAPLVLCYLEGQTNAQAATQLSWPLGTLQVRLFRGRELLRARLVRRGVTLSGGLVAATVASGANAAVSAALGATTLRGALLFAAGRGAGAASAEVAALTNGVLRTMCFTKLMTVAAAVLALGVLGTAAALSARHALAGREAAIREEGPTPAAAASRPPKAADASGSPKESRAWYVLRQSNTLGLFHGMAVRLSKVLVPSRRKGPMWNGVDEGGRLQLDITAEDDATGEVFVGFFAEPTWSAEPVQARRFPCPGTYTVERLIPGKFQLGAMIGLPPRPAAQGVQQDWPIPVEIQPGRTTRVHLRVSPQFKDNPAGQGILPKRGYAGQWGKMDPSRLITVRTVDGRGSPVPFCHITFASRLRDDTSKYHEFIETGTDDQGYAYCDSFDGPFSLMVQRFRIIPETLCSCFEYRRLAEAYQSEDRRPITVTWDAFPVGEGKVTGHVRDHRGRPVKEFYVQLEREEGKREGIGEFRSVQYQVPVMNAEGRYEVGGLPPGHYQVTVFAFDVQAYEFTFSGPKFILAKDDPKPARVDLEIEAKELFYGRAVYADGTPVYPGVAIAWLEKYTQEQINKNYGQIGRDTNCGLERDGSFRIALLRKEHEDFLKNSQGRVAIEAYRREGKEFRSDPVGEVPLGTLSRDQAHPARVVFPRKEGTKPPNPGVGASVPTGAASQPASATAKAFALELLATDGRTHRLADYRGKPVLLNVFTTWCGPCQEEMPHLIDLHRRYAEKGLVILIVSRGEEPAVVEAYANRRQLPFPVLVDSAGAALRQFVDREGRRAVPTNVLLDWDHNVAFSEVGYTAEKFTRLWEAVERVFATPPRQPKESAGTGEK